MDQFIKWKEIRSISMPVHSRNSQRNFSLYREKDGWTVEFYALPPFQIILDFGILRCCFSMILQPPGNPKMGMIIILTTVFPTYKSSSVLSWKGILASYNYELFRSKKIPAPDWDPVILFAEMELVVLKEQFPCSYHSAAMKMSSVRVLIQVLDAADIFKR